MQEVKSLCDIKRLLYFGKFLLQELLKARWTHGEGLVLPAPKASALGHHQEETTTLEAIHPDWQILFLSQAWRARHKGLQEKQAHVAVSQRSPHGGSALTQGPSALCLSSTQPEGSSATRTPTASCHCAPAKAPKPAGTCRWSDTCIPKFTFPGLLSSTHKI